jgi:hypothetical protein
MVRFIVSSLHILERVDLLHLKFCAFERGRKRLRVDVVHFLMRGEWMFEYVAYVPPRSCEAEKRGGEGLLFVELGKKTSVTFVNSVGKEVTHCHRTKTREILCYCYHLSDGCVQFGGKIVIEKRLQCSGKVHFVV